MRRTNYLQAVVIVHGKSEKQICQHIKQVLRLPIHIESNKKGKNNIQISSLMKILNNTIYGSHSLFCNVFYYQLEEKLCIKNKLPSYFKIFIIMDTDDCKTEKERKSFINKEMFQKHWAYEYIVPIFNTPELETVLTKGDIKYRKLKDERKKEYVLIFPTDTKHKQLNKEPIEIEQLMNNLKKVKTTNMDIFIEYCFSIVNNK